MPNEEIAKLKIDKSGPSAYRSRLKGPFYLAAAIIGLVLLLLLGLGGFLSPAAEVEVVTVGTVYPTQSFALLNASGYVVAQRKAAVASKITSRLVSIAVEEGTFVKQGDVIARLEHDDSLAARGQAMANLSIAEANLRQAQAELDDAQANFVRRKDLLEKGFIPVLEYDVAAARFRRAEAAVSAAEATVSSNRAALQGAEIALEYSFIRAPFDAVILTKNADIGDIITPLGAAANAKAAVVSIADMASLQVEVDVSESNVSTVKPGQPCEIQLDSLPDSRFRGVVHMIVPTADRSKSTVLVKVRFLDRDARILPEMSAKVAFLEREASPEEMKPLTAVPPGSIVLRNGSKVVFLVKDNEAVETRVSTGKQIGDLTEILGGVRAGDRIIAAPTEKLRNGSRIRVVEK